MENQRKKIVMQAHETYCIMPPPPSPLFQPFLINTYELMLMKHISITDTEVMSGSAMTHRPTHRHFFQPDLGRLFKSNDPRFALKVYAEHFGFSIDIATWQGSPFTAVDQAISEHSYVGIQSQKEKKRIF